jgi:dCMP deaminase
MERMEKMVVNEITEPFIFGKNQYKKPIKEIPTANKWDTYFHTICVAVASKSPCLSRKIGAILVRNHSIVSTGYNGPSRGIPHCGHERIMKDEVLREKLCPKVEITPRKEIQTTCPRKLLGFPSGEGMEWCTAQHAEVNCLINAARLGVSVLDTILYMNCVTPCKNCFSALINAGIREIVIDDSKLYDEHSRFIIGDSKINIRTFQN